jgi:hypothetical protein
MVSSQYDFVYEGAFLRATAVAGSCANQDALRTSVPRDFEAVEHWLRHFT